MSLAQQVAAGPHRKPCIVERLRTSLPIDELDALDIMLDDLARWPHQALEKILRVEGHFVSDTSLAAHREGRCCCG